MKSLTSTINEIRSPDGKHVATFTYVSEIRFGPPYFSIALDGYSFADRVFGASHLWSPDSRYFAIEEWLNTVEMKSPQTILTLFDLEKQCECVLTGAPGGFIQPVQFENGKLIYKKRFLAQKAEKEFEIEFEALDRWRKIGDAVNSAN